MGVGVGVGVGGGRRRRRRDGRRARRRVRGTRRRRPCACKGCQRDEQREAEHARHDGPGRPMSRRAGSDGQRTGTSTATAGTMRFRTTPGHDPKGPYASYPNRPPRLPCRGDTPVLPRPRRKRLSGLDGTVRLGAARTRPRRCRDRPSEAEGRGRTPGVPRRRPVGGRCRRRRSFVRGRVASLAAAEPDAPYAALVLFSYPLHPPGSPERTDARIAHWPAIRCPVLLLSGESDPFARIDLLRAAVPRLPDGTLVTYPRLGHTLQPVLDDVLDRVAAFLEGLATP